MERAGLCAAARQTNCCSVGVLKTTCSDRRDVFLYRDTVTARLRQNSDCVRGNSYDKRNGHQAPG